MNFTAHGKLRAKERSVTEKAILQAVLEPTPFMTSHLQPTLPPKTRRPTITGSLTLRRLRVKVITTLIISSAQEIINHKLKANVWVKIK